MKPNRQISDKSWRAKRLETTSGEHLFLLLTRNQWILAGIAGLVAALVFLPYYRLISPWLGVVAFMMGIIIVHLRYASKFIIPFPHIAFLIAALQYVLAAWASSYYPSDDPMHNIGSRLPEYLPFATLVLLACAAGWGMGLVRMRIPARRARVAVTPELLHTLDALLVLGLLCVLPARYTRQTNFGFLFLLLANLRYVAVYGRMVCQGPGWGWRLALVIAVQILFAARDAMFHSLILWGFWTFALWIFVFKPSWRIVLTAYVMALLLLPALQEAKWKLREQFGDEEMAGNTDSRSPLGNASLWLSYMGEGFKKTFTGNLDKDSINGMLARYNQGWIVDKVMQHMGVNEPYARGETLKDAFIAALVPRLFYPGKAVAASQLYMEKFAGIKLNEETAMGLGYAGEMYANFGYWGGIIGCGLYCLGFALLFRAVCIRAFVSPLWWAVMPYIGFAALKAEDDVVGVVNWTSKACVIMVGVCFAFPAFRRALFPGQGDRRQRAEGRSQRSEVEDQKLEGSGRSFSRPGRKHLGRFRRPLRN